MCHIGLVSPVVKTVKSFLQVLWKHRPPLQSSLKVNTLPEGQCVSDPWQPGTEIQEGGMLILEHNEAGQRLVQVKRDSNSHKHRYSDSILLRHRIPPSSSMITEEESRESVEMLLRTSIPTSLQTITLDSTRTPESSAE